MVSIITWVNDIVQYRQMKTSVKFDAEFIMVGQDCKSMAEAYNKGTKEAIGDWFIYCHQDIIFHDIHLDETLDKLPTTAGFGGVVGSRGVSQGPWWEADKATWAGKLIQGDRLQIMGDYVGPARNLDGMFLVTHRDNGFIFPEELPGIHFLDMWMCREAESKGYINWIIPSMIQHLSQGTMDEDYYKNLELYKKKWL